MAGRRRAHLGGPCGVTPSGRIVPPGAAMPEAGLNRIALAGHVQARHERADPRAVDRFDPHTARLAGLRAQAERRIAMRRRHLPAPGERRVVVQLVGQAGKEFDTFRLDRV